jgi:hypothetical protein
MGRAMLDKVNLELDEIKGKEHPFGELNNRAKMEQLELCRGNIIYPSKASLISGSDEAVGYMKQTGKA